MFIAVVLAHLFVCLSYCAIASERKKEVHLVLISKPDEMVTASEELNLLRKALQEHDVAIAGIGKRLGRKVVKAARKDFSKGCGSISVLRGDLDLKAYEEKYYENRPNITEKSSLRDIAEAYRHAATAYYTLEQSIKRTDESYESFIRRDAHKMLNEGGLDNDCGRFLNSSRAKALEWVAAMEKNVAASFEYIRELHKLRNKCYSRKLFVAHMKKQCPKVLEAYE